jgi:gluconokinase
VVIILMGVTGVGKTTVGTLLAERLGWKFIDADAFHSPASIAKTKGGISLTDADREPWLNALRGAISGWIADRQNTVLACSALKRSYRVALVVNADVRFVFLKGDYGLIAGRLAARSQHFAGIDILADQFDTLEEPEDAITVYVKAPPAVIVDKILKKIVLGPTSSPPTPRQTC